MNKCLDIGLKQCPTCQYLFRYIHQSPEKYMQKCWVDVYSNTIKLLSDDKELKEYFINKMMPYADWQHYFCQTVIRLFPERVHVIERLLILM